LDRKVLLDRVKKGQQFVIGAREEFLASTFKTGRVVMLVKQDDRELLATSANATRDELEEVPAF
jgi:hypothetical protein